MFVGHFSLVVQKLLKNLYNVSKNKLENLIFRYLGPLEIYNEEPPKVPRGKLHKVSILNYKLNEFFHIKLIINKLVLLTYINSPKSTTLS